MCVGLCMRYLCVEPLAQVGEQVFISICCFTVKPHNVIRTLADPVTNELHDAIQTGLLLTHIQINSGFHVRHSPCSLLSKTYPSRDTIKPGVIESWIQVNALNILHSANETHKQKPQPYKPQQLLFLSSPEPSCTYLCIFSRWKLQNPKGSPHCQLYIVSIPLQMFIRSDLLPECRCSILEMSPAEILKSPVYNTVPWEPSNRNLWDTSQTK